MKVICVLACWLTVAYGGVVPWTQSGEDYAINLYKQYCAYGDKGVNGDIHWYCKNGPQGSDEYYEHHKRLSGPTTSQKQVIFINTPSKKIRHKVRVDGEAGVQQDTNIYVLPPRISHEVDITGEIKTHSEHNKPHTFFLKKNPSSGRDHHHGYPPATKYPSYDLPTFVAPDPVPDYGYTSSKRYKKRSSHHRSSAAEPQEEQSEQQQQQPIWEDFSHLQQQQQQQPQLLPRQFESQQ